MGERREKITGTRKYIADAMLKSVTSYPQARGSIECDMGKLLELQQEYKDKGEKIALSALMIKLVATALKKFPSLNSRIEGDEIIYYDEINCGIGMDIGTGLYVLTIRDADKKTLSEINTEFKGYIKKLQDNTLTYDDIQGSTFTLTNFAGMRPEFFESIITNDQCIIVGIAGIKKKVVVTEDDEMVIRPMCPIIVNMNHAITDGKDIHAMMEYLYEICLDPKAYF
ncbi:2-oxo acid dehydrogenase subunit E2 [bacterium 210820-DFI.6.37]|nr:2-oxo acid dehydrogenase subunit E2 [bacterium 210820-DFI.6.37]